MSLGNVDFAFLAISGLLGFALGWFLRQRVLRNFIEDLEDRVRREEEKKRRIDRDLQSSKMEANRLRSEVTAGSKDRDRLLRIQAELKETRLEKEVLEIRLADRTRSLERRDKRQQKPEPISLLGKAIESHRAESEVQVPKDPPVPRKPQQIRLFEERPPQSDDLKLIKGIGKALERKLNQLGIYTFVQIAELDDQASGWVAENVGAFPDRIKRDRWAEQARSFAERAKKGS